MPQRAGRPPRAWERRRSRAWRIRGARAIETRMETTARTPIQSGAWRRTEPRVNRKPATTPSAARRTPAFVSSASIRRSCSARDRTPTSKAKEAPGGTCFSMGRPYRSGLTSGDRRDTSELVRVTRGWFAVCVPCEVPRADANLLAVKEMWIVTEWPASEGGLPWGWWPHGLLPPDPDPWEAIWLLVASPPFSPQVYPPIVR